MQDQQKPPGLTAASNFGRSVRAAREHAQWTQQQLSDALAKHGLRIDTSAITRIENGSRDPRLSEAEAIAAALDLPLSDLLSRDVTATRLLTLWRRFESATEGLVSAVYVYGSARRAVLDVLGGAAGPNITTHEAFDEVREAAGLRAIRDWAEIRARHEAESASAEYDAVFDAEA